MSTVLDTYMKQREIGDADLAMLIKRDRSVVSKIRRGMIRPTLDVAAAIETATDGGVPISSWVATCTACDRRTDDATLRSCDRVDCPHAHREEAQAA